MTPPVPPLAPGQQPPTQPQYLTGAQLNMRIQHGDPAFPNELWGRTVGEAMRYYSIMREDFKQRNSPAAQPAPPAPAAQPTYQPAQPPPAPTYPAARPPYVPASPAAPEPAFNEERLLARVGELVRAELGKSPATLVAADMVRSQMRAKFPDFAHYEQAVMEELRGTDPGTLANPDLWETTYFYVRGRASATGQGLPPAQAPAPAGPTHGPRGEWISPPPPPPGMHFVESPAGAPPASAGNGDPRNDPQNLLMARRFGVPIDEYVLWMNGNVPPAPGNGR